MDQQGIEHYIWENRGSFYRLAYAYVHNEADALDIVSASIVKALENKRGLRNSQAIKTWFYRIIVHTAIDFIRKNKRVVYLDDLSATDPGHDDHYADPDLQRALRRLPDPCRITVILRYFEDMPIEEIATVLNQNVNTVKSRLYRALEMLKTELVTVPSSSAGGQSHE